MVSRQRMLSIIPRLSEISVHLGIFQLKWSPPELVFFDRSVRFDRYLPFHFQTFSFPVRVFQVVIKFWSKRKWVVWIRLGTMLFHFLLIIPLASLSLAKWKASKRYYGLILTKKAQNSCAFIAPVLLLVTVVFYALCQRTLYK